MTPAPRNVLVVVTRRIGDVLLATPVIHSLKCAWPEARIDVLVFEGTQGVIAAGPDINCILTIPERPGTAQHLAFMARLFRRYDLALSLVPGDRPTLYAFLAGRRRAGLLVPTRKEKWKRCLLDHWVPYQAATKHTLLTHLSILAPLGVTALPEVSVKWHNNDAQRVDLLLKPLDDARFIVLHLYPKFNYKKWNAHGWIALASWLTANKLRIVLTGSGDAAELEYVRELARGMNNPLNLAGQLSLSESACVIARAAAYVGPDTALTHMAAALGVKTIALLGPTNPLTWGPWPKTHTALSNPWHALGDQSCGNVLLLQGSAACVPCSNEGCDRHVASYSDCLVNLPPTRVINALQKSLKLQ